MGSREDNHLPVVQAYLAARLGRPIRRVSQREPTRDLETADGEHPSIAIEVKELVPQEFLATQAAIARGRSLDSTLLHKRWTVAISEDPLSERLAPMPRFRDVTEDERAWWAERGFVVASRAEREEEWRQQHNLAPRPALRIGSLARDIEPHLAVLERLGISQTRTYELPSGLDDHRAAVSALRAVSARTNDSICMAHDPIGDQQPGIDLAFGYGYVRAGRPDVVAQRVQDWLDSESSMNLIYSLRGAGADERHAALWLSTEAETESARHLGADFVPRLPLRLPSDIDVLWCFIGLVALRYAGSWSADVVSPP